MADRTGGGRAPDAPARRRARRACIELVAAPLIVLGASGALHAQAGEARPPRARLSVQAPQGCMTEAALVERVHARARGIEFAAAGAELPQLRVSIEVRGPREVAAELVIDWSDGRRSERRLRAASCDAAADALSFLIAWTLDPNALRARDESERRATGTARDQSNANAETPETSPEPASQSPESQQSPERATPPPSPVPAQVADVPTTPDQQAAQPAGTRAPPAERGADRGESRFDLVQLSLGPDAQLITGPAPGPMPGVGLAVLVALRGSGPWLPALRLGGVHGWLRGQETSFGRADFTLDAGQLDACPLGLRGARLRAHACLVASLGSLFARGTRTYAPQSRARLWASLGAGVLLSADLLGPLELEAAARLERPLRRDRFAFTPEVFHRVAQLCFDVQLALALRFP